MQANTMTGAPAMGAPQQPQQQQAPAGSFDPNSQQNVVIQMAPGQLLQMPDMGGDAGMQQQQQQQGGMPGQVNGQQGGGGQPRPCGPNEGLCSIHNKPRKLAYLHRSPDGTFQCRAPNVCKGSGSGMNMPQGNQMAMNFGLSPNQQVYCAIHNKLRSVRNMTFNGVWTCLPFSQCQVSDGTSKNWRKQQQVGGLMPQQLGGGMVGQMPLMGGGMIAGMQPLNFGSQALQGQAAQMLQQQQQQPQQQQFGALPFGGAGATQSAFAPSLMQGGLMPQQGFGYENMLLDGSGMPGQEQMQQQQQQGQPQQQAQQPHQPQQ